MVGNNTFICLTKNQQLMHAIVLVHKMQRMAMFTSTNNAAAGAATGAAAASPAQPSSAQQTNTPTKTESANAHSAAGVAAVPAAPDVPPRNSPAPVSTVSQPTAAAGRK